MNKKYSKQDSVNLCKVASQIQNILERNNIELVVWPNVEGKQCIFAIQKGDDPWNGARVSTITQKNSFLNCVPKLKN